jgi:hypothetical protein
MGLREGCSKNTGPSKAFLDTNTKFLDENIKFFKNQLDEVKPKLVIGLGNQVPLFIGKVFEKDFPNLNTITSFKKLDTTKYKNATTIKYNNENLTFIFITHPAMYDANVWRRKNGKEFEKSLIDNAIIKIMK